MTKETPGKISSSAAKVALITGASRGIGAATARQLAQAGYDIVVNYAHNQAAAEALCTEIEQMGQKALPYRCDIASEREVCALFAAIDQGFGRLDALVNNAGILMQQMELEHMNADRISRVLAVNITGSFLCAREAYKRMAHKHGGHGGAIVNVSSAAARLGAPGEYIDYAASKGAIDSMTIGFAKEAAAEGIRVNAVRPGVVLTDIHASGGEPNRPERVSQNVPLKRAGTPEEIAASIVWLLSDAAAYTTGALLDVSGGR